MSGEEIIQRLVTKRRPEKAVARLSRKKLGKAYWAAVRNEPETDAARYVHGLCILEAGARFAGGKGLAR
ncbi:hypothetical protein OVA24_16690 [Luteolibacter sp. SL250]|uniref:hypothetical protein n=1 Tax=Luteolibacter sp. SL250 TaxID=2995170 RepID=UPI002270F341|nr:hypothetical protein [Luteolibacter sp. SL250]WAC18870.1 hypothetical protein OVA24_16690 [Luteolibacter sp. SL250]